jgi:hypothetical protein
MKQLIVVNCNDHMGYVDKGDRMASICVVVCQP